MKQLSIIIIFSLFSVFVIAQKQEPIKIHSTAKGNLIYYQDKSDTLSIMDSSGKSVLKYKRGSDTLLVDNIKFIKLGDKVWPKEWLEKMMTPLFKEDIETILTQIQELPAKSANPFTDWLLKFLGLSNSKPNSKQ